MAEPSKPRRRWFDSLHPSHKPLAIALCVIGGGLAALFLAAIAYDKIWSALETTWQIQIIVPNEYRGWFVICERPGAPTGPVYRGKDAVRYDLPTSGFLETQNGKPFSSWHKLSAEYADGVKLPAYGFDGSDEDVVMLHEGRADAKGNMFFFIGSYKEFQKQYDAGGYEFLESSEKTPAK